MKQFLSEKELPEAIKEFVNQSIIQLNKFGYTISNERDIYSLKLDDNPINDKLQMNSKNGRCWFRKSNWSNSYWPHSDSPGVYFFFDNIGTACYVGKSETKIGFRARSHSGKSGPNGNYPDLQFTEAEYLISIPFESAPFLAPAFESFLLKRYKFLYNKQLT